MGQQHLGHLPMEGAPLSGLSIASQPGAHASQVGLLPQGQLLHLVPDFQGRTQRKSTVGSLGVNNANGVPFQ